MGSADAAPPPSLHLPFQSLHLDAGDVEPSPAEATFYEVTVASVDQPKLLSRLSEALGDLGLNICEAHAFNTQDGFSLDVFVVNGWGAASDPPGSGSDAGRPRGADDLEDVLSDRLQQLPPPGAASPPRAPSSNASPAGSRRPAARAAGLPAAPPLPDDFELGADDVVCHERVASGAFGDLYRGVYCGAEVAVKILRNVASDSAQLAEFLQEVNIMRKVGESWRGGERVAGG